MGAAEGSYFGLTDLRYVASKASPQSGISFGISQLDASQGPGRTALKLIVDTLVASNSITRAEADALILRYSGNSAKHILSSEERKKINGILGNELAKKIIIFEDDRRVRRLINIVTDLMYEAGMAWHGLKPSVAAPSLLDDTNSDFQGLFAYLAATLNKNEQNRGPLADWAKGYGVELAGTNTKQFALGAPPKLSDFHALGPNLKVWTGANGNYGNLRSRMKMVDAKLK